MPAERRLIWGCHVCCRSGEFSVSTLHGYVWLFVTDELETGPPAKESTRYRYNSCLWLSEDTLRFAVKRDVVAYVFRGTDDRVWKRGHIQRVKRCTSIPRRVRTGQRDLSISSITPNVGTDSGAFSARIVIHLTLLSIRWAVFSAITAIISIKQMCGTLHTSESSSFDILGTQAIDEWTYFVSKFAG